MAAGTVGYTSPTAGTLLWPITGGVADDHGYLRFVRDNFLPEVRIKAMQLQAMCPHAVMETIPTQGAPIWIDAYKKVRPSQDGTSNVPKIQANPTRFAQHNWQTTQTERRGLMPTFRSYPERFAWQDSGALMRAVAPGSRYLSVVRGGMAADADLVFITAILADAMVSAAPDVAPATTTFANDGGTILQAEYPFAAGAAYDASVTAQYGVDATGRIATPRIAGMTVEKLNAGVRILRTQFGATIGERILCLIHSYQVEQLLNDVRMASGDFNSLRPLQAGVITQYGGVTFIPVDVIPAQAAGANDPFSLAASWPGAGNSGRYCYLLTESAMGWGRGATRVEMDVIPHLQHLIQCVVYDEFAAVRLDGQKIVAIECADGVIPA